MDVAIELARRNVAESSGGPFGAAVFASGSLVSAGVSLVETSSSSIAHAEIVAIAFAQRQIRGFDLGARGQPVHELVTSVEPCAMCLGAIQWSGVRRVVCGAHDADARAIGFDEGHKPKRWIEAFGRRGIEVEIGLSREAARAVLADYAQRGGLIYNGRRND